MARTSHRLYGGAHAVAVIFKIASILVIIGGVGAVIEINRDLSYVGNKGPVVVGIIAGTVFTAAAVAFFAYVLDLLIGIERNTFPGRSAQTVEASPPRPMTPVASVASPQLPTLGQPGWYADPDGVSRVRYWDGSGWTSQTQ
jgi:hypothetical protein